MEITRVCVDKVSSLNEPGKKLKAEVSVTFDDGFVIHKFKVIQSNGRIFVATPCRQIFDLCKYCSSKNHLRAKYCSECGKPLPPTEDRCEKRPSGRYKLYEEIAHPIRSEMRTYLDKQILLAFSTASNKSYREVSVWFEADIISHVEERKPLTTNV